MRAESTPVGHPIQSSQQPSELAMKFSSLTDGKWVKRGHKAGQCPHLATPKVGPGEPKAKLMFCG